MPRETLISRMAIPTRHRRVGNVSAGLKKRDSKDYFLEILVNEQWHSACILRKRPRTKTNNLYSAERKNHGRFTAGQGRRNRRSGAPERGSHGRSGDHVDSGAEYGQPLVRFGDL